MKTIPFLLFSLIFPMLSFAQDLVSFKLTPEATFITEAGENYVVVPFENKNAHQIYQILASNVGSVYNNPSNVMSTVEDTSIKIRAFLESVYVKKVLGISHSFEGYSQLEFRIKDGRVRVSAPYIEDELICPSLSTKAIGGNTGSFSYIVSKWYKNGELKEKEAKNASYIEVQINAIINSILGLCGTTSDIDDDW